ncbi:hypothetical protein NBRC10512_008231 [Rhodotorula toruloides]|uniref:RHTO0S16e02212g1_1 n=1 Tax=Rhodotorula toruloides TaxID=5286 RepID=A0A061BDU1_RHOTO|nr:RHTO0S16e02212g1_1 [Rhodotorula toruloides]
MQASPSAGLPASTSMSSLAAPRQTRPGAHVEYVLLAEFDIDQGSVLRHQYPCPTGTDEHLLAEHMLPDGAHDRPEDWTVFYLGQIPPLTIDRALLAKTRADLKGKGKAVEGDEADLGAGEEDNGLLYVMSLVRTKKDASVRRGALVKALAVVTRNPYIQIFKPALLFALEDYFNNPSLSVLSNLYDSLNSMDTSGLPSLTRDERLVLRSSERKDLFEEKFVAAAAAASADLADESGGVRSSKRRTASGNRGSAPTDAVPGHDEEVLSSSRPASTDGGGQLRGIPSSDSLASASLDSAHSPSIGTSAAASRDDLSLHGGRSSRANTISSMDDGRSGWSHSYASAVPPPPLPNRQSSGAATTKSAESSSRSQASPTMSHRAGGAGARPKDTHFFETKVVYNGISIPVKIPVATFPSEIGDYSLIKLVQTFSGPTSLAPGPILPQLHTSGPSTPALIVLLNAILTGHRVVFLGHQQPAGRVAELVLAACALASGSGAILQGFEERAFPYTNLSNLDNLQNVPGFIAGVCNPAFADRPSWWDVFCNLETGKVVVSKELKPAATAATGSQMNGSRNTIGRASDFASWASANGGAGARDGVDELGMLSGPANQGGAGGRAVDGKESLDGIFMDEIMNAIQSHYGESVIRARFTDYVYRFVRLASRYEEETTSTTSIGYPCSAFASGAASGYGAQSSLGSGVVFSDEAAGQRELASNAARIDGWMKTQSYKLYQQSFRQHLRETSMPGFDLMHQIGRLRQSRHVSSAEAVLIFQTLAQCVRTDEQAVALLAHLPSHFGGLLPLAFGFFHASAEVRHHTLDLFDQLSAHPTGAKLVSTLNAFHRLAYARLSAERHVLLEQLRADEQPQPRDAKVARERDTTITLQSFAADLQS